jgi:hypothetical protein
MKPEPKIMKPPALATWLLTRMTSGSKSDSVIGDLVEEYQNGRSRWWYRRQVIAAILASVARDVSNNKWLAVRASLTGLALYLLMAFPVNLVATWFQRVTEMPLVQVNNWLLAREYDSLRSWLFQILWFQVPSSVLVWIACLLTGAIVVRLHPTRPVAMVFVASLSILIFESLHVLIGFAIDGGQHQVTPLMFVLANAFMLGRPLSIFIGGLLLPPKPLRG